MEFPFSGLSSRVSLVAVRKVMLDKAEVENLSEEGRLGCC